MAKPKTLAERLKLAAKGKIPGLHQKVVHAGYLGDLDRLSASEIARMYNVTPQAIGLWHSKNNCPRNSDGTYSFLEVLGWKIDIESEKKMHDYVKKAGGDPQLMGPKSPALEKYREATTEKVRLDIEIKKSLYVLKTDVNSHWIELGHQIAATIELLDTINPESADLLRDRISAFKFTQDPNQQRDLFDAANAG